VVVVHIENLQKVKLELCGGLSCLGYLLSIGLTGDFTFVFVYAIHSYLVTVMGLVIPWSITLLVVDAYSVFIKCLPLQRRLVMIVFLGDMVRAICDLKNL